MKIDLDDLKNRLQNDDSLLVDAGYLEWDLKVLYDYYTEEVDRPPSIDLYFDKFKEFDLLEFLKAYIKSSINYEVNLEYTSDGWLEITNCYG